MKRYHQEKHIIDRRYKERKSLSISPISWTMPEKWSIQRGRYRKKHPLDCGNTRCGICHSNKRFGHESTRQELAAAMRQQET